MERTGFFYISWTLFRRFLCDFRLKGVCRIPSEARVLWAVRASKSCRNRLKKEAFKPSSNEKLFMERILGLNS